MRYMLAITLWLTAGPVFAQGVTFDLGRHGGDWDQRSERMDRDYGEHYMHGGREGRDFERDRHHARHLHGRKCIQWDEDEGTWRRVC